MWLPFRYSIKISKSLPYSCRNQYYPPYIHINKLEGIISVINDTVKAFYQHCNYKQVSKEMMPFCRSAVEKYMFSKLFERLSSMYTIKFSDIDKKYMEKKPSFLKCRGFRMMELLGVNNIFFIFFSFVNNLY